jgi:translocation and assembly module TamB
VRVSGGVSIVSFGQTIAPEGTITASRGSYLLNLGVVQRAFSIDSGSVRFYGNNAIPATVDISATNIVRATGAGTAQIPVRVHIGGTLDVPVLTLSSPDPLFTGAPDSEIISLLIFGAPSFTLDGRSQSTVRAVADVLAPTVGGVVQGTLQRFLPFELNTFQVQTSTGQDDELTRTSLLENLSITAGKQLSDKTFLRVNTGVCRGAGGAASAGVSLWGGFAIEYLLAKQLTLQVGVDPGASPCSAIGGNPLPRLQFGFDLFREWIF